MPQHGCIAIRAFTIVWLLLSAACFSLGAEPSPLGPARPAVTYGLIRWWPNLFDARDQVSGEDGVIMGVLPETRIPQNGTEPRLRR